MVESSSPATDSRSRLKADRPRKRQHHTRRTWMQAYDRQTLGWAIAHAHGLMHTNWLLGRGVEAWPGMLPVGLFSTRQQARTALERIRTELSTKDWPSGLPFTPRIVQIVITELNPRTTEAGAPACLKHPLIANTKLHPCVACALERITADLKRPSDKRLLSRMVTAPASTTRGLRRSHRRSAKTDLPRRSS